MRETKIELLNIMNKLFMTILIELDPFLLYTTVVETLPYCNIWDT